MTLERYDQEIAKARTKADEWQARLEELERKRKEEENLQIVNMVRSLELSPAQLAEFIKNGGNERLSQP